MIEVKNVTKYYGSVKALETVSFKLEEGKAAALLGSNGAGKTTLIRCILGLLDYEGEILIKGINVKSNSKLSRSMIAYVPQEPALYDIKTLEILRFFASLRKISEKRVFEVLYFTNLKEHMNKLTSELSGGMKQRLSFAIALLTDSPILILDEPTSNLDKQSRIELLNMVKFLKDDGKTIIFSSHRADEVLNLTDVVIFMKSGNLIMEDSLRGVSEEIISRTKIHLIISKNQIHDAINILNSNGYTNVIKNGNSISLETNTNEKIQPLNILLSEEIDIEDFNIEKSDLEELN